MTDARPWRPPKSKKKSTLWKHLHAEDESTKRKAYRVREKYDITSEEWVMLWREQGGKCIICDARLRNKFDKGSEGKVAAVDHDHAVERREGVRASVRGLLCAFPCNRYLVKFWTPERLRKAADHVESPSARRVLALCKAHGSTS